MTPELKEKWAVTLESGNYKQCTRVLRSYENECCCLGVLCDIVDPAGWSKEPSHGSYDHRERSCSMPIVEVLWKAGLTNSQARALARLNDSGDSFSKIAAYIRSNL